MRKLFIGSKVLSIPFAVFASSASADMAPPPDPSMFTVIIDAQDDQPVGGKVSACTADGTMRILGQFTLSASSDDLAKIDANPDDHFDDINYLESVASIAIHMAIASMPEGQVLADDGYSQIMQRTFHLIDQIDTRETDEAENVMGLGLNFQPTQLKKVGHGCEQPPAFRA